MVTAYSRLINESEPNRWAVKASDVAAIVISTK